MSSSKIAMYKAGLVELAFQKRIQWNHWNQIKQTVNSITRTEFMPSHSKSATGNNNTHRIHAVHLQLIKLYLNRTRKIQTIAVIISFF